jgi:hypothetical protein
MLLEHLAGVDVYFEAFMKGLAYQFAQFMEVFQLECVLIWESKLHFYPMLILKM